jgi:hypothetical protein
LLKWFSPLVRDRRAELRLDVAERAINEALLDLVIARHENRLSCGAILVDLLSELIPSYDLGRGIYAQLVCFILDQDEAAINDQIVRHGRLADNFANSGDAPASIAARLVMLFLSILWVNKTTQSTHAIRRGGTLFVQHSRALNDLVQYFLFHTGVGAPR